MSEEKSIVKVKELCTVRIVFPVDSDDQALNIKRKLRDALGDVPQARLDFSLTSMPPGIPNGSPIR